jgi:hypothetical protein
MCGVVACREEFATLFEETDKIIGFSMDNKINAARFNKFLTYIENKLKLKRKSTIYKTNFNSVILIRPAPFWLSCEENRSWLTLFIRCGIVYYKDSFIAAYKEYDLTNVLRPVINRFLGGYTKLVEPISELGIVDTFCYYDDIKDKFKLWNGWEELMEK